MAKKPTYSELQSRLSTARRIVEALSTCPDYGITTRPAIIFQIREANKREIPLKTIFLLTLNKLEEEKSAKGASQFNKQIKRIAHVRNANTVIRARIAEDKIIFILSAKETSLLREVLVQSLRRENISGAFSECRFTFNIESDIRTLEAIAQAHKEGYQL